jgi:uncharacterized repeat protein (TIGR03803 family)
MMDAAGNLYGTVKSPDKYGAGVIELSPSDEGWTWQAIYNSYAYARLTMDASGNIFGVETKPLSVAGLTAFELWPNGAGGWNSSVIYRFGKNVNPQGAPVVIPYANTEMLFGTTESGGGKKQGTVYRLWGFTQTNGRWEEKNVYGFKGGTDGSAPYGGVIGDYLPLYGTTTAGGQYDDGIVFEIGAGFKEKVLWSFNGTDGAQPYGSLITDKSGNLYGTTTAGGSNNAGVVFEVTP